MRTLSTAWKHIRRSPYQAMAAILAMFLTFLLTGFFFLTSVSSAAILQYFEGKPQITVFFRDQATQEDANALSATLEASGKTASVNYITKEEALATYRTLFQKDPLLLEMVTADILPASLEVSATSPQYLDDLAKVIASYGEKGDIIEEVVYQKDVVDALISWSNAIKVIGAVLAALLAVDALLIVMTVIGMKIALRRDEIEILKLVGASSWYIRLPFLWEGALYGIWGATAAWAVLMGVIVWMRPVLLSFLEAIPVFVTVLTNPTGTIFLAGSGALLGVLLVTGFLLGIIGSSVSVGRYLKF